MTTHASTGRQDALEDIVTLVGAADDTIVDDAVVSATVKMKLNQFVTDAPLRRKIDQTVAAMNQLMAEAYVFANFHVVRALDSGDVPVPKIDRNFYYRCLLAVGMPPKGMRRGTLTPDILATATAYHALRGTHDLPRVDLADHNQLVADMSITMSTMATNHLLLNLQRRIEAYVKWRHPNLKGLWKTVVTAALNPNVPLSKMFNPKPGATTARIQKLEAASAVARDLRKLIGFNTSRRTKSSAHTLLPFYRQVLLETIEAIASSSEDAGDGSNKKANKKKKARFRPFTLLPIKGGFTISHIPISTMTFLRMIRDREGFAGDGRNVDSRSLWAKYCNLNLVETKRRLFAGRIVTDGCAVSVLLDKKSSLCCSGGAGKNDPMTPADFKALLSDGGARTTVVGVDPGFTDIVTVAFLDGKTASYSSAKYYDVAKFDASRRCTDRWNAHTATLVEELPRCKTADVASWAAYVQAYLGILRTMIDHRMSMGYRNMRFMRHVHKDRAIEDICDLVAPRDKVCVVGFGDWSGGQGSCVSRRTCGPIEEVKHRLSRRENVVFREVSEFRTSQTCSCCHGKLTNMVADVTSKKKNEDGTRNVYRSRVHKVLHCRSSVDDGIARCGTTWNRDVNASKNMLALTMMEIRGLERPEALCRKAKADPSKTEKLRGTKARAPRRKPSNPWTPVLSAVNP